ncbi:FMN-binding protein [Actinomycetospora sp. NBRC 106375]|uniref:FMN-binding protein n=1 Tax=Actinomycetospora sp. NBRC 106375 TaxID=3032207 RepID=UPI002553B1D4|nr:FMN-binding protein [Actinomycetospora sp. NBRC 106375]
MSTVVLLFGYKTSTSSTLPSSEEAAAGGTGATTTTARAAAPSTPATSSAGSSTALPAAANGTFTGSTASTRWGPVQTRVTVASGRITAVDVVQYPDGNGKDREINADAIPQLVDETVQAQSADIDMVSGATVTSTGYLDSLQSALDQARAA